MKNSTTLRYKKTNHYHCIIRIDDDINNERYVTIHGIYEASLEDVQEECQRLNDLGGIGIQYNVESAVKFFTLQQKEEV